MMELDGMSRALNFLDDANMHSLLQIETEITFTSRAVEVTALCSLVWKNDTRGVEFLITTGHDVNEELEDGRTAIFIAAELGSTSMMALLIHHGANVNVTDCNNVTPLHVACFFRHQAVVKLLLSKGANIHTLSIKAGTPILSATSILPHPQKVGDPCDIVSLLIKHGANVNDSFDEAGYTALLFAVQENNVKLVDLLIAAGADVNLNHNLGGHMVPLLSVAIRKDLVKIVESFLRDEKLDLTMTDAVGHTALHDTCVTGNLQIAKLLVERNINLNVQSDDLNTPLHIAMMTENFFVAQYLLQQDNIDVNCTNRYKDLPLHLSVHNAGSLLTSTKSKIKVEVTKKIIDKTKDLNAKCCHNLTPLSHAISMKDYTIVDYLVKKGSNVNLTEQQKAFNSTNLKVHGPNFTRYVYSVLQNACRQKNNLKMVSVLLANGAEVNYGPTQHRALSLAIQTGDSEIARELQNYGAEIDKECVSKNRNIAKTSPSELDQREEINNLLGLNLKLLRNVRLNDYEAVKESMDAGACVNVSHARWGGSSLIYASWKGYERIVDLLLAKGANVNFKSASGFTSLHMASRFNSNTEIVRKLLLHGAHYNMKDDKYMKTPLQYSSTNNVSVYSLLKIIDHIFEEVNKCEPRIVKLLLGMSKHHSVNNCFEEVKHAKNDRGQTLLCLARSLNCEFLHTLEHIFQEK